MLAEEKLKLLEEKLGVKDDRLAVANDTIKDLKEQRDWWKTAAQESKSASADRKDAGTLYEQRLQDHKEMLAKANAEIERLRHPGLLASVFDTRTLSGAVVGYGVCKATSGGNSGGLLGGLSSNNFEYRFNQAALMYSEKMRQQTGFSPVFFYPPTEQEKARRALQKTFQQ